ncbi:MAG: TIGR03862 family flavoprotein [Rhizobiales bacterium]|nr:TIGR03862 family flavoprotein [Hyphomicrobiales bacterium]MBI3671869.1 TIGR03862 family flavoprotein [Hyphomicrobiales bacterium]
MAAEVLASGGASVSIFDHKPAPARKFLLAGRGGLNLTHSEPLEQFLDRYGEARGFLDPAIRGFPPEALIAWANGLGIETFVGTSGRVFPKQVKASPLLRAWLRRLDGLGVRLVTRSPWPGFTDRPTILALGGASWPHLGSDATWVSAFTAAGIGVNPFTPANSRFLVNWSKVFRERFAGTPVKNVALAYAGHRVRGEVMISSEGIEGGAIYAVSKGMRERPGHPLVIDLRPDMTVETLDQRLARRRGKDTQSNFLRKVAGLTPVAISLLRETGNAGDAAGIKAVQLQILRPAGIARAISSAGGLAREELDETFQLKKIPGTWCVGEMLDWEAPTGGYLLQACFSTAVLAARSLLKTL